MSYVVSVPVLAYAQFAALESISFGSRLHLVSIFIPLHSVKTTRTDEVVFKSKKSLLSTTLYFISQTHSQSE